MATLPAEARNAAFFSSGVNKARILEDMQRGIDAELSLASDEHGTMNRTRFVSDMRELLGAPEGDSGSLKDITSRRRLELIHDFQIQNAFSESRHATAQDEDYLQAFPARELIRVEDRKEKRDWQAIWQAAGGKLYNGRMIARQGDPIWTAISQFGNPWAPFAWGSGMDTEDIDRDESLALGVLQPDQPVEPEEFSAAPPEANVAELSPDALQFLERLFGDALTITDGIARWTTKAAA
ncbi:MAG: hypothetical protein LBV12_07070 [Puniceicoccales bacterium]|nr:hypothetical protein [Puniceicoccales bacterium]